LSAANISNPTANPLVNTTYTVTKTNKITGCFDTDEVLVTVNNAVPNAVAGDDVQIVCGKTTATLSGSSSTPNVSFSWVASNSGHIVSGADTATPIVDHDGTYTLTVTSLTNGCTATDVALVTTQICAKALCTYTQGYYGNVGGLSCAPDGGVFSNKYTTEALIAKALASYGGTMTIGMSPNSVWMTAPQDIDDIIRLLPGGSEGSYALTGNYSISDPLFPAGYLSKKGTLNNTLLAQTITLGLNIGINGALGNFVLQGGLLTTAAPEGGCGSDIPKERKCIYDQYGNLTNVINEYQYYSIDANVVAALNANPTVQGLFELANKALGGGNVNGLSLSSIADVIDKINNAFDGCRIFLGYDVPKCPGTTTVSTIAPLETTTSKVGFEAYPVPFKDQLTIKYKFDYVSDVKIDVFNAQGISILSKADSNSYLDKEVTLNLNVKKGQEQVYVVKVTTDKGSSVKKVMSSK
jgi:hypothetical protein